jgi:hypothetical protein
MDNKGKPNSLTITDDRSILVQDEAHIGTYIEQASSVPVVKNRDETERIFIHCGPFSKKWKSLKCLPLEEQQSTCAA